MSSNNYLIDNFSNASNWQVATGTWSYSNGEYYTPGNSNAYTGTTVFTAYDIVFECDIQVSSTGDAGVQIRSSSSSGTDGYYVSIRPAENALALFDVAAYKLTSVSCNITPNSWQRIRVIMIGNKLTAIYGKTQLTVLNYTHGAYESGRVFLRSYYNQTSYKNVKIYGLNMFNTDTFDQLLPTKWIPYKGDFTIDNERLINTGGNMSTFIANSDYYDNFILEADLSIDGSGNCGFFIRNTDPINDVGYFISFSSASNQCTIYNQNGSIGGASVAISTNVFHHIKIICFENHKYIYFNNMHTPILVATNDNYYTTGRFGIHTYYTACKFDNITIKNLEPEFIQKVRVLNYNPFLTTKNMYLYQYMNWNKSQNIAYEKVTLLLKATENKVFFKIVDWVDINNFPDVSNSGHLRFNETTWLQSYPLPDSPYLEIFGQGDFNYDNAVIEFNLINDVNNNVIDEVWIFGDWEMGTHEVTMIGDSTAFDLNQTHYQMPGALRNFVVMGYTYQRGVDMMLECMGHRAEWTFYHYFGSIIMFTDYLSQIPANLKFNNLTIFDKFIFCDYMKQVFVNNDPTAINGVGWVHVSPSMKYADIIINPPAYHINVPQYVFDYPEYAPSNYLFWKNYENSNYPSTISDSINCKIWGCGDREGHHFWWLSCIPTGTGVDSSNRYRNWWRYILLKV